MSGLPHASYALCLGKELLVPTEEEAGWVGPRANLDISGEWNKPVAMAEF